MKCEAHKLSWQGGVEACPLCSLDEALEKLDELYEAEGDMRCACCPERAVYMTDEETPLCHLCYHTVHGVAALTIPEDPSSN